MDECFPGPAFGADAEAALLHEFDHKNEIESHASNTSNATATSKSAS
jgi:hypothetical protein